MISCVSTGKTDDNRWVAEVDTLTSAESFDSITQLVNRFNALNHQALPKCLASEATPGKLYFILSEAPDAKPKAVFGSDAAIGLSSEECVELAHLLVEVSQALGLHNLGLWEASPQLCWMVGKQFVVIPAFWMPLVERTVLQVADRMPPETRTGGFSEYSERAEIFAIAFACYEALADAPPRLPNPKLPGEWSPSLAAWDAALDAGLRVRPERRSSTLSDWAALLPAVQPRIAAQAQKPSPIPKIPVISPRRNHVFGVWLIALCCIALVAILGLLLFHKLPNSLTLGGYQRGFADSVIRYENKSYVDTSWKKIYTADRLLPEGGSFHDVSGWDRSHFAVFGKIRGDNLVLLHENGEWQVHRFPSHGAMGNEIRAGRFLDAQKLVLLLGKGSWDSTLAIFEEPDYRPLGDISGKPSLFLLAPDAFCGSEWSGDYWEYLSGKVSDFKRHDRQFFVLTDENAVASCKTSVGSGSETMGLKDLKYVTTVAPGDAIGLWSSSAGVAAVVRYHDGSWRKVQELTNNEMNDVPKAAWCLDERNMICIGGSKVIRIRDGVLAQQSLEIGGQEYPSKTLFRVWGNSINKYWVADQKGNIFGFEGTAWHLLVRGPDFATDEKFDGMWISPEGVVIAVTDKDIYRLE